MTPLRPDLIERAAWALPDGLNDDGLCVVRPFRAVLVALPAVPRPGKTAGVPEIGIAAGDVLLVISGGSRLSGSARREVRGNIRRLPREHFPCLLDAFENDRISLVACGTRWSRWSPAVADPHAAALACTYAWMRSHDEPTAALRMSYAHYLRGSKRVRTSGQSDDTSPVLVVKPWRSGVTQPIRARSDEGAVFELLASVGCTPPRG